MKKNKLEKIVVICLVCIMLVVLFKPFSNAIIYYRINVIDNLIEEIETNYPIYKDEYFSGKQTSQDYINSISGNYIEYNNKLIGNSDITYNKLLNDVLNDYDSYYNDIITILNDKESMNEVINFTDKVVVDIQPYIMIKWYESSNVSELTRSYESLVYTSKILAEMDDSLYKKVNSIEMNYNNITIKYDGKIFADREKIIKDMLIYTEFDDAMSNMESSLLPLKVKVYDNKEYRVKNSIFDYLIIEREATRSYSSYKVIYMTYIVIYELEEADLLAGYLELDTVDEFESWMAKHPNGYDDTRHELIINNINITAGELDVYEDK